MTKADRRHVVQKLERDIEWYADELRKSKLSHEIEVQIYKDKLDEVIAEFNKETASAKAYIESLHQKIQKLELDLSLKREGFFPGFDDDPYIDVAALMDYPLPS